MDKLLNDIHLEFRDKYKNELADGKYFQEFKFMDTYNATLKAAELWAKSQAKQSKQMRTFEESTKSKKTVASMIERKGDEKPAKPTKKKEVNFPEEGKYIRFLRIFSEILTENMPNLPTLCASLFCENEVMKTLKQMKSKLRVQMINK